ncbi:hypothetical protein F4818DRAFT_398916 [Hypoxylon cercidicola]|nr:hypothetical protein F4818DRAFT_398916 [Hypoxylon cercidicola]
MAVLEDVPGIKVVVVVAGNEANEYDDPNAADQEHSACPISSKYIECVDGAEFSVKAYVNKDYAWGYRDHSLVQRFTVDGKHLQSPVIKQFDRECTHVEGYQGYCDRTKQWFCQKCKFSVISTVDDAKNDRIKSDIKLAEHLGMIQVTISRCIVTKHHVPPGHGPSIKSIDKWELAEKSLKGRAMSHGTSFSTQEKTRPQNTVTTRVLEEDGGPIAIFRFHYRSRDALKREMVIPRSPSPGSRPVAQMSRDELERLAKERLDQLQKGDVKEESKAGIKREFGEIIDLSDEHARPSKSARQVEVIDLTDD